LYYRFKWFNILFDNLGGIKMFRISKKFFCLSLSLVISLPAFSTNALMLNGPYNYRDAFLDLYGKIKSSSNGYFSTEGIPYYSPETFIIEEVDYGHETTSTVLANYLQLEAINSYLTGDWSGYNNAWDIVEKYAVPKDSEQTGFDTSYDPFICSEYYPEGNLEGYPQPLNISVKTGKDPLYANLLLCYGKKTMFGIHSLLDVDNWQGYGNMGDGKSRASKINITGRGPGETIWQRLMIPAWDTFSDKPTFMSLVYKSDISPKTCSYTTSSTGDTNIVKSAYYANKWASIQDKTADVKNSVLKAAKLGDYLRYSFLDKYMKPIGCNSIYNTSSDTNPFHYLISSGYTWGSNIDPSGFAWIKGSHIIHQKNQNPMAAYALSSAPDMIPKAAGSSTDWKKSMDMQLEFLQWLQSAEGAIAGGCTNSWGYNYQTPPISSPKFYNMAYDRSPGAYDPSSNSSFLSQLKSMVNLVEYYYETGDKRAQDILQKWVEWVKPNIKVIGPGEFEIPCDIEWEGQPDSWNGTYTGNPNLHATIISYSHELETAAMLSRILLTYSYATKKHSSFDLESHGIGKKLLDSMILGTQDEKGYSNVEQRGDYSRVFDTDVYIPEGWESTNGQGAKLKKGCKYLDTRPALKEDADWLNMESSYKAGVGPKFKYHRFSAQCEIAMALFAAYIEDNRIITPTPTNKPTPIYTPTLTSSTNPIAPSGDINNDGVTNMADAVILAKCFGLTEGETGYVIQCDLNRDKRINMADVVIIAMNFGRTSW
jgi:hypothetical protein